MRTAFPSRVRIARDRSLLLAIVVVPLLCAGLANPVCAGLSYEQVILSDNPVGYWRFEEGSRALPAADSATGDGAQNGTYIGPAGLEPGIVGQALRVVPNLAGADGGYVRANGVNMTASFSVETWARSVTPNWNANGWLPNDRGANGFMIHPDNAAKTWRGFIVNNAGAFEQLGSAYAAPDIQQWHHYAVTYDDVAKVGRVYFDGVLVATKTGTTSVRSATSTVNVLMGRDSAGTGSDRRGDGWLDEVAVYQSVLSQQQIRQHIFAADGRAPFAGPNDPFLDLRGNFVYAVDVGNTTGNFIAQIGDARFTGEAVAGVSVTSENIIFPAWGPKPEYGGTPEADALEAIMHSIRYDSAGVGPQPGVAVNLNVTPGFTYQLQLLFSENGFTTAGQRAFDIQIEGATAFDEWDTVGVTGPWSGNPTLGAVLTRTVRATDSQLNILLSPGTLYGNHDAILNAFTLELVPEPSSLVILGLSVGLLAPAGWRRWRRARPAA